MHGARTGAVLTAEEGYELRQLDSNPAAGHAEQDKASEHQFAIDPSKRAVYTAIYTAQVMPGRLCRFRLSSLPLLAFHVFISAGLQRGMRIIRKLLTWIRLVVVRFFAGQRYVVFPSAGDIRQFLPLQLRERHFGCSSCVWGRLLYINGVPVSTQVAAS